MPRRHSATTPGESAPPPIQGGGLQKESRDLPDWARCEADASLQTTSAAAGENNDDDEPGGVQLAAAGGGAGGAPSQRRTSQVSEATSLHGYESDERVDDYPSEIPPPQPRQGAEAGLGATLFAQSSVKANANPTNSAASRRDSLLSVSMGSGSRRGSAVSLSSGMMGLSLLGGGARQGSVALE